MERDRCVIFSAEKIMPSLFVEADGGEEVDRYLEGRRHKNTSTADVAIKC